jgi:hypothetical protein
MTIVFVEAKNCCTMNLRMSQSVYMIQVPRVAAPHVWTFAPYVFPQSPQNIAIEFFCSPSVLMEQIPYAQCLQCQNFATFSVMVLVEGSQECPLSSTNFHPFLKCLNDL